MGSRPEPVLLHRVPGGAGALALQPVIAGRYRHPTTWWRTVAFHLHAHHHRPRGRPRPPHALRPRRAVKPSLTDDWAWRPALALYFDPDFAVRLHLEPFARPRPRSCPRMVTLSSGLVRTLRHGQRPPSPTRCAGSSARRHAYRGDHGLPRRPHAPPSRSPRTTADKTHIRLHRAYAGDHTTETFPLEAQVKIFGAGPIVERFIEPPAREIQENAVAFMRPQLER